MGAPSFVEMCRAELELCGIGEDSSVAVLSQGNERQMALAARRLARL